MLNYNDLPNKRPLQQESGTYYAVITNIQVRESQKTFKEYLNLTYTLIDKDGNDRGVMYDILTDSNKGLALFKLKKFLDALELRPEKEFNLKYIYENSLRKGFILEAKLRDNSPIPRLEVNVFKGDVFYNLSRSKELFNCEIPEKVKKLMEEKMNDIYPGSMSDDNDMPF